MDRDKFKQKIEHYLKQSRYSQAAFARELGYTPDQFNKWLIGTNIIRYDVVKKICEHLNLEKKQQIELFDLAGYPLPNQIVQSEHDWLWDGSDLLADIEAKTNDHIWIVSPHLKNDTTPEFTSETVDVVNANLKRGITYIYIVPDTDDIKMLLPRLEKNFKEYPGQLKVIEIPSDTFDNLANTEYAIYNPNLRDNPVAQHVFMQLPVDYSLIYWVKVVDDVAIKFVDRVKKIMDKGSL